MAYTELIKNLDTLRTYIRSFYIYGFKTRDKFHGKSPRTYDDEKRRLENYLDGYMTFRADENGKVTFLSIDSRRTAHNPLYKIFKAKSFTAMDISLHFILMDILCGNSKKSLSQILDEITESYLKDFSSDAVPEESTMRKKLKEYEELGLISSQKEGKVMFYSRNATTDLTGLEDALAFFSETAPSGVAGSFLFDRLDSASQKESEIFQFKHHYITASIESDFVEQVFKAIREKKSLKLMTKRAENGREFFHEVVPMMIYQSTQDGRMYLMAYSLHGLHGLHGSYFLAIRFDYIVSMEDGRFFEGFEQRRAEFEELRKHVWGVALKQNRRHSTASTVHVTFCVHFEDDEKFIYQRLLREKRCGTVTLIDENNARFDADVFDPVEVIPWIRTFICRITFFDSTDKTLARRFYNDIQQMMELYADTEDETNSDSVDKENTAEK